MRVVWSGQRRHRGRTMSRRATGVIIVMIARRQRGLLISPARSWSALVRSLALPGAVSGSMGWALRIVRPARMRWPGVMLVRHVISSLGSILRPQTGIVMLRIGHVHARHGGRIVVVTPSRRHLHRHRDVHHPRLHALLHVRGHRRASLGLLLRSHVHRDGHHLRLLRVHLLRHVHLLLRAVRMDMHLPVCMRAGRRMPCVHGVALALHVLGGDLLRKGLHLLPRYHAHGIRRRRVHHLHDLSVRPAHLHRRLHVLHALELHVVLVLHFEHHHLLGSHLIRHIHLLRHVSVGKNK